MIQAFEDKEPDVSQAAFVATSALVLGDVQLGKEASIWYGTIVRGDVHRIRIGDRSNVQDRSVVHVTHDKHATTLGCDITVGHGAIIHGCTIGDSVLVGMGAIILDGVEVGSHCVIAAGSLLPPGTRYPSGSLVVGSPARVTRPISEEEKRWVSESASHYVLLARRHATLTEKEGVVTVR